MYHEHKYLSNGKIKIMKTAKNNFIQSNNNSVKSLNHSVNDNDSVNESNYSHRIDERSVSLGVGNDDKNTDTSTILSENSKMTGEDNSIQSFESDNEKNRRYSDSPREINVFTGKCVDDNIDEFKYLMNTHKSEQKNILSEKISFITNNIDNIDEMINDMNNMRVFKKNTKIRTHKIH